MVDSLRISISCNTFKLVQPVGERDERERRGGDPILDKAVVDVVDHRVPWDGARVHQVERVVAGELRRESVVEDDASSIREGNPGDGLFDQSRISKRQHGKRRAKARTPSDEGREPIAIAVRTKLGNQSWIVQNPASLPQS